MQDTSIDIKKKYREMLLKKAGVDRMIMGSNMAEAARTMAIASMLSTKSKKEEKIQLFLRFYGNGYSLSEKENIIKHLKNL